MIFNIRRLLLLKHTLKEKSQIFSENVPSSNTPGFVTPASKRTSKTPSINPSVTAEVNENSECEAIENIDADIGDDHFDLGGPDETYDPPVENLAQSTTPKAQTPTRLNSYASFRRSVQVNSFVSFDCSVSKCLLNDF